MTDLSILVPVLSRPQNVAPLVNSAYAATGCDFEIVFLVTKTCVDEIEAINDQMASGDVNIRIISFPHRSNGDYANKINVGYAKTTSPWLFTGADDIHFHHGWFDHAERAFVATGRRVVGTRDLGNSRVETGVHSTHSLVHRSYVEEMGTVDEDGVMLHEGYPHEFVDDEFIETAKMRDEFVHSPESIVEHLHPLWGKAPTDATYNAHRKRMVMGRRVYQKRQRLWMSK